MKTSDLNLLKDVLGVVYFTTWSLTFWPQSLLNSKRRCTRGFSHEFAMIGWVGFVAYGIFTCGGYLSSAVKAAYVADRGAPPPIEWADVGFAVHALIMSSVLLLQTFIYQPGFNAPRFVVVGCIGAVVLVIVGVFAASTGTVSWVVAIELCGFIKVISSLLKHIPQALSNYERKSTVGFSIALVLLDFTGSGFSLAQQGVRCIIDKSLEPYTGNLSKLALASETFLFDILFCLQHFVWYRNNRVDHDAQYSAIGDPEKAELWCSFSCMVGLLGDIAWCRFVNRELSTLNGVHLFSVFRTQFRSQPNALSCQQNP